MKILQLISSYGFFGSENVVFELSRGLKSHEIENIIGVFENAHNPHIEIIHHAEKNNLKAKIFRCNGKVDFKTFHEIREFVREKQVSIIHTHGYKSNIYGFFIAKVDKKPIPIVSTCHNWIADDPKTRAYYWIDKFVLKWFDEVIAVSEGIKDELLGKGMPEDKIRLIYNGVNINKYDTYTGTVRNELKINEKTKVIGTVARLTAEKGLSYLLEAFKKVVCFFSDSILIIVGDGPLGNELREKACELGISDKVIFTGKRTDLAQIYSTMDIFVLPSLKEGLPMVILEAMASRKPIIATNVGGIPGVIENGREGILVRPKSVEDLNKAIITLLKDHGVSRRLAYNAREKVVRQFSSEIMCNRYIEVYRELLQQNAKMPASTS